MVHMSGLWGTVYGFLGGFDRGFINLTLGFRGMYIKISFSGPVGLDRAFGVLGQLGIRVLGWLTRT